ncbi:MAG: hypothetical protein AVDCRST_MAG04-421, partial [uncultured Acetobacteraceae bacterium]
ERPPRPECDRRGEPGADLPPVASTAPVRRRTGAWPQTRRRSCNRAGLRSGASGL